MTFRKAARRHVPMLIALAGVSGSGKTYSALLLAAGLTRPGGRIGFIDTEAGRGEMYADDPGIMAAMPGGYEYMEMRSPFSPENYIKMLDDAEKSGVETLVVDSGTHEWEGTGGCHEIAENNKSKKTGTLNWILAKRMHKTWMNRILASRVHVITCLRAREKVKVMNGGSTYESLGIQPVCEKNFMFEMTLSALIDEGTHLARPLKVPKPLEGIFPAKGSMISKATGEAIRAWASGGAKVELTAESLTDQAMSHARQGVASFREFWKTLAPEHRIILKPGLDELQEVANTSDQLREAEARGEFSDADGDAEEALLE